MGPKEPIKSSRRAPIYLVFPSSLKLKNKFIFRLDPPGTPWGHLGPPRAVTPEKNSHFFTPCHRPCSSHLVSRRPKTPGRDAHAPLTERNLLYSFPHYLFLSFPLIPDCFWKRSSLFIIQIMTTIKGGTCRRRRKKRSSRKVRGDASNVQGKMYVMCKGRCV